MLTGFEPAITWVKTKRLIPFAYSTKNLAQGLRFELRKSVLETEMLPVTSSLHLVAVAGLEPAFTKV